MSHFAQIQNGKVAKVIVADSIQWCQENLGGEWVQTSYNTIGNKHLLGGVALHKNYAGIDYTWDGVGFASPQPYPSWSLNKETYLWEAPTPQPTDDKVYRWDEDTTSWVEVPAL
jgi:hypothetical protein